MIYRTLFQSNLISEYLDLVYRRYILTQPGILVNYYSSNIDRSTFDTTNQATYGTPGGDLSGITYDLYHNLLLPFGTRATRQESDSQEKGFNSFDTTFQIFMPSVYGIRPSQYDYMAFRPNPKGDIAVFQVSGIEESTIGSNPNLYGYYLTCKPTYLKEEDIKVNAEYAFDTFSMQIVDINTYNKRLKLFIIADLTNKKLRKHFNYRLQQFTDELGQVYDSKWLSIIAYTRPLISTYFKDLNWIYANTIDSDFMNLWNQFLETKNPEVLGLNSNTPFNEDFINYSEPPVLETTDDISVLDSFILIFRLKHWLEDSFNG